MKVLAIDQGTTGTKAFTYDVNGNFQAVAKFEHTQIYPQAGWVEHDPLELLAHLKSCIAAAGAVDAVGIDNQGETIMAWNAQSKRPIYNAIVWQDSRTSDVIAKLKSDGAEELTLNRAGLALDPYFSASKMRWIIDHVPEAKILLSQRRLRLGTSDAFFLDSLTGEFATDVTTASRTSLMNVDTCQWDDDLCALFKIPRECLPEIRSTTGYFGIIGKTPITANLVDQQAALFGHGCEKPGDAKMTFGTGAFALAISGAVRSATTTSGLSATIAWALKNQRQQYALEGGVYNAASAVNWAKSLGLFNDYAEINSFEVSSAISRGLVFVPALSGLACPHWDRSASGLWIGMGLNTTKKDLMQSILEGIGLRSAEVIDAISVETGPIKTLSIDGGLAQNPYFVKFLAEAIGCEIRVAGTTDITALGTARMALIGVGQKNVPNLPASKMVISPDRPRARENHIKFAKAVSRAKAWNEN